MKNGGLKSQWPVLRVYNEEHLHRIALPLGGIGTGTVSLGGRGDLRDWEIMNRPAKGFYPPGQGYITPCLGFVLYARPAGSNASSRLLEGPLDFADYEGSNGICVPNHGMPRFRRCSFAAAYPLGQVFLSDPDSPLKVRLEAFNPLIPGDSDNSGLPVAVFRYVLLNESGRRVEASVCGTIPNFIGVDGSTPTGVQWTGEPDYRGGLKGNRNEHRKSGNIHGVFLFSRELHPLSPAWGTIALAVLGCADSAVTWRTGWAEKKWNDSFLDFWDDFSSDGRIEEREHVSAPDPKASLCASIVIGPHSSKAITFLLAWHFPNRKTWTPAPKPEKKPAQQCCGAECPAAGDSGDPDQIGNYYTTLFRDAWDVVEKVAPRLPELERKTVEFVRAFCGSDLPDPVKEAALFNLSTLRTQTCFRTPDGFLFGWEGCHDRAGCCHGSCTHVWNYENAVAHLFGDLSRNARRLEFLHATDERGLMSFRINLPLSRAQEFGKAAADGQMGCIVRAFRDWKLSGDMEFLRQIWPKVRKAVEFCWIPGGWDADRDGVMEGCQHNTMDVEYYGPNGQMTVWYLAALRAAEEMARAVGENDFADRCRSLFEKGSKWTDENLFNGEYYEHIVRPPASADAIAPGLQVGMGASDLAEPEFQLGPACLVDQLVGQYMARAAGLGYLLKPENVRSALRSIMKYNFRKHFFNHFNHMRTFATGDESALLMATYPRGNRPKSPFPYCNEVMTGFEYTAAVGMLYEGMTREGLRCIKAVRDRYDGRKRSPFDEAECGHHYARAMASWTAVMALSGFQYSGIDGAMRFAGRPGKHFWSNGQAWGTCAVSRAGKAMKVSIRVLHGCLKLGSLELAGYGERSWPRPAEVKAGHTLTAVVRAAQQQKQKSA